LSYYSQVITLREFFPSRKDIKNKKEVSQGMSMAPEEKKKDNKKKKEKKKKKDDKKKKE
jgi:hypothetical protein